jgi:aspartate ammonia-lyase
MTEHDLLGERLVPAEVYYGIQTLRALENYHITGIPLSAFLFPQSRQRAGDGEKGGSQGQPETRRFGQKGRRGHLLHPNNHVKMSQSTNDVYPTAIRLAILLGYNQLTSALADLAYELKQKSVEFSGVIKMGRTQLQDAVPMTLGQEFDAFRVTIKEDIQRIHNVVKLFQEINLGATAIGTGITANPEYSSLAIEELARISGIELVPAENLVEATSATWGPL